MIMKLVLATALLGTCLFAQQFTSLPQGFEATWDPAAFGSGASQNVVSLGGRAQVIFDTSMFGGLGPMVISNLYVATLPTSTGADGWAVSSLEVTMGSCLNDHRRVPFAGTELPGQAGHNANPDLNFSGDQVLVRPALPWSGRRRIPFAKEWWSWDMRAPFVYDPAPGLDFMVDVKVCGTVIEFLAPGLLSAWGSSISAPPINAVTQRGLCTGNIGGDHSPTLLLLEYKDATGVACSFGNLEGRAQVPIEFWDRSWTPNFGGITSYLWDFGDGTSDTGPGPFHSYACHGTYAVTLTVTDGTGAMDSMTRMVTVEPQEFVLTTMGGGVGDLMVTPPPLGCFPGVVRGYTLLSLSGTAGIVGQGAFLGMVFDQTTLFGISQPPAPGSVFHFLGAPGVYPDVPLSFPIGSFSSLSGVPLDAAMVYFDAAGVPVHISNVAQVVF